MNATPGPTVVVTSFRSKVGRYWLDGTPGRGHACVCGRPMAMATRYATGVIRHADGHECDLADGYGPAYRVAIGLDT